MTSGYIVIKEDIATAAAQAVFAGDVTFPYVGAYEYFKNVVDANKPILLPAYRDPMGENSAPAYVNSSRSGDTIFIRTEGFKLFVEAGYPNRISLV